MAKTQITVKIPDAMLPELADNLWQSGRPTDPPLVAADPLANPPIVEVPAPPLTDAECIRRWVKRELRGRYKQLKQDKAEQAALAALDPTVADGIE